MLFHRLKKSDQDNGGNIDLSRMNCICADICHGTFAGSGCIFVVYYSSGRILPRRDGLCRAKSRRLKYSARSAAAKLWTENAIRAANNMNGKRLNERAPDAYDISKTIEFYAFG